MHSAPNLYPKICKKKNNTFWLILKVHCKFFTIHCNRVNISFCTNLVKIWSSVQRFYLDKQFSFFCFSKLHILSMAQNNSICFNNQPIILLVAIFFFSRSYNMKVSRKFNQNKIIRCWLLLNYWKKYSWKFKYYLFFMQILNNWIEWSHV